jgi:hypothetical protein
VISRAIGLSCVRGRALRSSPKKWRPNSPVDRYFSIALPKLNIVNINQLSGSLFGSGIVGAMPLNSTDDTSMLVEQVRTIVGH